MFFTGGGQNNEGGFQLYIYYGEIFSSLASYKEGANI